MTRVRSILVIATFVLLCGSLSLARPAAATTGYGDAKCDDGGPGHSTCNVTGDDGACEMTCPSTHYACCMKDGPDCACKRN
jgi:hypothetical protein